MNSSISVTSRRSSPRSERIGRPSDLATARPLRGLRGAPFYDPALVRAHVGKVGRVEGADLDELVRQPLCAPDGPVRVDELDPLPAVSLVRLEDRANFDLDPRLLANLAGERVLEALAWGEEPAEETPFRRAETMACQDHVTVRVDPEPDDADKEPRLGAVEDAPLPADRERVVEKSQQAEEHRRNSTALLSARLLFHVPSAPAPSAPRRASSHR